MSTSIGFVDRQSSEVLKPHIILTADDLNPKEIDDGLIVERLPGGREAYRVGVCVVDTSGLYADTDVTAMAFANARARYNQRSRGRIEEYVPMIDEEIIHSLEFKEGNVRDALILWFTAHRSQRPSDFSVEFGRVEVAANYTYKRFDSHDRNETKHGKYGRAAAFLMWNLAGAQSAEADLDLGRQNEIGVTFGKHKKLSVEASNKRGSRINAAYMVAANYLNGCMFSEAGKPAIYRRHGLLDDPESMDYSLDGWLSDNVATYSLVPGPHDGLGLELYSRATSPLRRLEDYMMLHQLRLLYEGKKPSLADVVKLGEAVRELNSLVVEHSTRRIIQNTSRPIVNKFSITRPTAA